jgi:NAD(P)-dependent dehydrogenase (short-subunit alcohol dehydrogenase family)
MAGREGFRWSRRPDVTKADDIEAAALALESATEGRGLWGLVNNAGVAGFKPLEETTLDEFRRVFEINVMAPFALTNRLLPLLREAGGRIVNISSINAFIPFPICGAYNATKAALDHMSATLRLELEPWGIGVSVVQPGVTATDIREQAIAAWTAQREHLSPDIAPLYEDLHAKSVPLVEALEGGAANHDDVKAAVADALTSEAPKRTYLAGPDTAEFAALGALPPDERDAALRGMFS